jgi:hypothetical protein
MTWLIGMLKLSVENLHSAMPRTVLSPECFDPEEFAILKQAFDDAWKELEPKVDPFASEDVREEIANALISMAACGQRDPERLWCYVVSQGQIAAQKTYFTARKTLNAKKRAGQPKVPG